MEAEGGNLEKRVWAATLQAVWRRQRPGKGDLLVLGGRCEGVSREEGADG